MAVGFHKQNEWPLRVLFLLVGLAVGVISLIGPWRKLRGRRTKALSWGMPRVVILGAVPTREIVWCWQNVTSCLFHGRRLSSASAWGRLWPASLSYQAAAIQRLLPATGPDPSELAPRFGKRTKARIRTITEILDTLTAFGKI